ncbi:MAG: TRAP transporter TatT component family protein [Acidobacteriota bacterium]|nr:TRAP transporter TatT component family protein [Acidobacteriota bacterium]
MKPHILPVIILLTALAIGLQGATPEELILQGDALYARRGEAGMAGQALAKYQEALALSPGSFEALIKNAQALYYVGDNSASGSEKQKIFKQGMDICKKAVALRPDRVEGHYWLGVHTGSYGEARGVLKSLFLKNDIIDAMNRSIAIDGAYENGGAYCVLGRLYFKVPGLFGGSKKKSRQNLEKCLQLGPKSSVGRLFLAETYWALDEKELAIRTLEELLAMEPDPSWVPETEKDKKEGAKLLEKYKK